MNMRFFLYLFLSGSLLAILIACIALLPSFKPHPKENVLSYNDVRGMAVESDGVLYTLNFEQQNQVISALNKGEGFPEMEICAPTIDKLVVYRFSEPEGTSWPFLNAKNAKNAKKREENSKQQR